MKNYSRFHNKKVEYNGIKFDSKKECERYKTLKELEEAGEITDLRLQVKYELIPKQKGEYRNERACTYIADFVYKNACEEVVEDTKGMRTPEYIIKRKLMLYIHNINIKEV